MLLLTYRDAITLPALLSAAPLFGISRPLKLLRTGPVESMEKCKSVYPQCSER
jgi:hypothetical protein